MNILIFTGGTYPKTEYLSQFFQKNKIDYIICADSGCDLAVIYNKAFPKIITEIDVVCGDLDSISSKEILSCNIFARSKKELFPSDKDYTDTEIAVQIAYDYAESRNEEANITLIGGSGGRIDHFVANYDLFAEVRHPSMWFSEFQALYFIPKDSTVTISNVKNDESISILRTTASRIDGKIISHGFKWESNVFRKIGVPSLSNRISDEGDSIEFITEGADFILCCDFSVCVNIQ